ncbi:MAG: hypothetical protein IT372_36440 [Polyangiaceae bacterium]|nr:hypothetical protein [Polyangiaceae bacterium]
MFAGLRRVALGIALTAALAGCGPATYNVRAARAYGNEDADPAVVADRAADLERAAALADEVLLQAPYSPGDRWIAALRLDDDEGDELRDRLEDAAPYSGRYELPLAKLYRLKIEAALRGATAPRAAPPRYRGLLEAAAALAPGASALPASWRALVEATRAHIAAARDLDALTAHRRPAAGAPDTPEIAAARVRAAALETAMREAQRAILEAAAAIRLDTWGSGSRSTWRALRPRPPVDTRGSGSPGGGARGGAAPRSPEEALAIARDLVNAVSFVERMHIEALAVAPYVVKQARRLARSDAAERPVVERARALGELLEEERAALDALAAALADRARTPLADAAGYELHEGLISQAAAIHLDATHLKIKADADLLFFHGIASAAASGGKNDYTGRTRRLEYHVDPVFMIGARAILTYDFAHVRNAASLNAGFKTNRLFSRGGDLEYRSSLGELLGLEGIASDFFDIGADLLGFSTTVKFVTFTSGEVTEIAVDPATDRDAGVVGEAPFQLRYAQVDVGFDLTKIWPEEAEDLYVEAALVGFRYMDYELPRIFYELSQRAPGEDSTYVFDRQSPAQTVGSLLYQGGLTLRLGDGEWSRLSPFADLGLYGGAGPVSYHFSGEPTTGGGVRSEQHATMLALSGNASLGLRLRLTSFRSRPRLVTEVSYSAEIVGQGIVSSIRGVKKGEDTSYVVDKKVDLGGFDLFHGPRLLAVLVF